MGYFDLRPPINSSGSEVCHLEGFDISLQDENRKGRSGFQTTYMYYRQKENDSFYCMRLASKQGAAARRPALPRR